MENEVNIKIVNDRKVGIMYGIIAFVAWGILPLYWRLLNQVPSEEILAHRIFWSFVYVSLLLVIKGDYSQFKTVLSSRKNTILVVLAAVLISINWFTYIWAVNSNYVVQASLGYYINPLVVSFLGVAVLKEKFNRGQIVALGLATIGVLILTVQYGRLPWISIILAVSFALYGLMKKMLTVDSMTGLALETILITPIALSLIIFREVQGVGSLRIVPIGTLVILMLSGVATATPLLWFAKATQKVEFSTVGFLQYIAPTISLFIGVFLFKEEFTKTHFISFAFIWTAIVVYTVSKTSSHSLGGKGQEPAILTE